MTTSWKQFAALAASVVMVCATAACSSGGASQAAGHGTTAQSAVHTTPVTLTVGTDDFVTYQGAQQIQHFAQEVSKDSHHTLNIEPVYHAGGTRPHWDQYIAGMVKDGRLDMGMVPSRAWDRLGVTSLSALTTPFLITTDSLSEKVLSDPKLAAQLNSGLPKAGFTALGLYPDGLRHPFGFHGALKGAADYRGKVVRTPYSQGSEDIFRALGAASVTDEDPNSTTMVGADSEYELAPDGVATGNVTFYPKVNVLVMSRAARKKLDESQLAALDKAAKSTEQWAAIVLPDDATAAATFCGEQGSIVGASPAQVASLVSATRGVVAAMRQDPTTAHLIDEITALKAQDQPARPVTACPPGSVHGTHKKTAIDATYSFTLTVAAMRAAGVTDQNDIDENAGTYLTTLSRGTWRQTQNYSSGPKKGTSVDGEGEYELKGHRLKFYFDHQPGDWATTDVTTHPDGSVTFADIADGTHDPQFTALDHAEFAHWVRTSAG